MSLGNGSHSATPTTRENLMENTQIPIDLSQPWPLVDEQFRQGLLASAADPASPAMHGSDDPGRHAGGLPPVDSRVLRPPRQPRQRGLTGYKRALVTSGDVTRARPQALLGGVPGEQGDLLGDRPTSQWRYPHTDLRMCRAGFYLRPLRRRRR